MTKGHLFIRTLCMVVMLGLVSISVGSCQLAKNQLEYDRSASKDRQDYRDALSPQPQPEEEASPLPELQSMVATPEDLKLPTPLVTVSVNQTVSLRELLFELAEQAGVDLEMDPQIRGSIIFTAKERPFANVVDRICEMTGLRYTFEHNVLRVELDRPYVKNYRVDYMNMDRKSTTSIKTDISVSSDAKAGSSTSGSTGKVDNSYSSDFWKELSDGLKQVLTSSDTYLSLATLADPVSTPIMQPLPALDPNNPSAGTVPSISPPSLNVTLPTAAEAEAVLPSAPATFSLSKQSGVVSVFASERQHKLVAKFLKAFRDVATTQILIEAKVMEVALSDEYATGIDWGSIKLTGMAGVQGKLTSPNFAVPSSNLFKLDMQWGDNFRPVINALSRFGTVRALSSPRVTVMNNQPAVVNVSRNRIYFDIQTTTIPGSNNGQPTTTKTGQVKSAPEGVLMNVLPTANRDTGEIILSVRPTVSKITSSVEDPVNIGNKIPELSVQEIDSVVTLQSGQTMVMGGLMKDQNNVTQEGIPVLGDVPMVGALFRNHSDNIQKSELVIFLRAQIVNGNNADATEKRLYDEYGQDRHPARLQ